MSDQHNVRALTHITAGHANWVVTPDEEAELIRRFISAARGDGVFLTRPGVRIQTLEVPVPEEAPKLEELTTQVVNRAVLHCVLKTESSMNSLELAVSELRKLREEMGAATSSAPKTADGAVLIEGDVTLEGTFSPKQ